jgi:seryl-tRNA synthetase
MLDIKRIRETPDEVKRLLATRGGGDENQVDVVLEADEKRRVTLAEVEKLKAQRNQVSKEIGMLMGQKKFEEAEARKQETKDIGDRISELDQLVRQSESERDAALMAIPNLPNASVPIGKTAEDNPIVRIWGEQPVFSFEPKSHVELCDDLDLVDFARATKLSGSGFLLFKKWGAKLQRALIQYLLDTHTEKNGFTEVSPPFLVHATCMEGVGQFPKFKDQAYAVREGEDDSTTGKHYLIPTAEAPVANLHREEILKKEELPLYYCAYSPCFRAEAGAAGLNTRGMIRVHQFDKVEMIKIVEPDKGYEELESMVQAAEAILQELGLHYRTITLCTGDMGFAAAKTYDIEVWAPGQKQYLEVSSCSNCEDYQSRRMQLRYKSEHGNQFPHLLNGSGLALPRLFVALVETWQQADGSITIPEPLRPYFRADTIPF